MAKDYSIGRFFPSAEYIVENAYMYAWECDIFLQMKSGYHYEIEQKISRSDFKADFKKSAKHFQFQNSKKDEVTIPGGKNIRLVLPEELEKFEYDISELKIRKRKLYRHREEEDSYDVWLSSYITRRKNIIPNRFFYIAPKGLLRVDEIPKYAGLLEYEEGEINQVKSAPFLHKNKYNYNKTLLDKYKYRYLNLKQENRLLKSALKEFKNIYESPINSYYQEEIKF